MTRTTLIAFILLVCVSFSIRVTQGQSCTPSTFLQGTEIRDGCGGCDNADRLEKRDAWSEMPPI